MMKADDEVRGADGTESIARDPQRLIKCTRADSSSTGKARLPHCHTMNKK